MEIRGLQKTTLLDYPQHIAATVFVGGCNFRCPFCHNGELVLGAARQSEFQTKEQLAGQVMVQSSIPEAEVLAFLRKRRGILQGVCITGGEPTLQPDLPEFIRKVKDMGYSVKLDTNGYRPEVLRGLLAEGLLDYVAMDIKASKGNYAEAAGVPGLEISRIEESVYILKAANIDYEFRTTVVKGIHSVEEFEEIGKWLAGAQAYYLQAFRENENMICTQTNQKKVHFEAFSGDDMEKIADIARKYVEKVELRGIE